MLELSLNAAELLRAWVGSSTWHSNHTLDRRRFYQFVRSLWEDNQSEVDGGELRERIVADTLALYREFPDTVFPNWTEKGVREAIRKGRFVEDANLILDYLANEPAVTARV